MIDLRMNIWWENIVQLGIPLFIFIGFSIYAIIKVRKDNKNKWKNFKDPTPFLKLWDGFSRFEQNKKDEKLFRFCVWNFEEVL